VPLAGQKTHFTLFHLDGSHPVEHEGISPYFLLLFFVVPALENQGNCRRSAHLTASLSSGPFSPEKSSSGIQLVVDIFLPVIGSPLTENVAYMGKLR
jgi:hypothetical protein